MAVIPTNLPQTSSTGQPPVQSAQVKAAQAAFFRAALGEVQATPQRPQPTSSETTTRANEPDTPRMPRLGQLLDIRV